MNKTIINFFESIAFVMATASASLVLAMSGWITYDVLTRSLFGFASPWAFDLSEYALVWITFLGAPWVLLQDRHVRIEIVIDCLSPKTQRRLGIIVSLVAIAACLVLAWKTGLAAWQYYDDNIQMPRIWRIPRIWPYVIIPVGSLSLSLAFLVRLYWYLTEQDPESVLSKRASAGQETSLSHRDGEGR